MNASAWEDLKEEICMQLLIGKENGEPELETMARIVWLERQKCFNLLISGQLRKAADAAVEAAKKTSIDQQSGGLRKGKVLKWKASSRSTGASALATGSCEPASTA